MNHLNVKTGKQVKTVKKKNINAKGLVVIWLYVIKCLVKTCVIYHLYIF